MTGKERINQRFSKDFNLPINIFNDDMFEYYHTIYKGGIWPEDEWVALNKEINEDYGGNMDLWLEHYAQVRDVIIKTLESSEEYKNFNSCDMSQYVISPNLRNYPDRNIYNEECAGKTFLSLDLKKANFQALKYAGVISDATYEDFIDKYDKSFYFKKSKYTRQVIFGKLNPKRTINVEHYMMSKILGIDWGYISKVNGKVVAFKSDELIWELDSPISGEDITHIESAIENTFGFKVRGECFTIEKMKVTNARGNNVDCYIKRNLNTGEEVLKSVSAIFYPQVYKYWKKKPSDPRDLKFYFEDQIATFDKPLIFDYEDNSI